MMKQIYLFLILISPFLSIAQIQDAWIYFTDKKDVVEFVHSPERLFSQEALDRKQLHNTPVDFRDVPLNPEFIDSIKQLTNFLILAESKWLNGVFVRGREDSLVQLLDLGFIREIEFLDKEFNNAQMPEIQGEKLEIKNEKPTISRINYGASAIQNEMINVNFLHDLGFTGEGMNIAFLDAGYPKINTNPAFTHLFEENRIKDTYDFATETKELMGAHHHGSLTLSVIAGKIENEFVGTAPDANYFLYRTEYAPSENPVEEAWLIEGLERADSAGADIVNISLGYKTYDNPDYDHYYEYLDGYSTAAARAVNIAMEKGLLVVVSAGNDGNRELNFISTPADAAGALTLGAVDGMGQKAGFSSFGPAADGRVKPDVMAMGKATAYINQNGSILNGNGTSFSAPITAGALACLWQSKPELSNTEIIEAVRRSASNFNSPNPGMGYGIPDFQLAYVSLISASADELSEKKLSIYPNPFTNYIQILNRPSSALFDVEVYDILGKQIYRKDELRENESLNLSTLAPGTYQIKVITAESQEIFSVIKH